ncbi:MAG: DUF4388 domain-containing protein [Deltaproteobacteria bacterium]|nr:DUF4388 domain-containing protein [Deltaproteobacteria bacterium]
MVLEPRAQTKGEGTMGEAALSGNLNAVGLLELLRIPMTTGRTGTLIVVNSDADADEAEARFYYREGTLVAGALGSATGEEALRRVIGWKDGFFEFLADTTPPDEVDPRLHALAMSEIKNWYTARTSSRPGPVTARSAPNHTPAPPRPSYTAPTLLGSVPRAEPRPMPLRAVPVPKGRPSAAIGSATLDARGNVSEVTGTLGTRDGALGFAALQLSAAIGKELSLAGAQSVEIRGKGERWLGAATRGESSIVLVCPPDADLRDELARK